MTAVAHVEHRPRLHLPVRRRPAGVQLLATRRVRVLVVPMEMFQPLFERRARLRNVPGDYQVIGVCAAGAGVGAMVYSPSYSPVPDGDAIPTVTAAFDVVRE